MSGFLFSRDPSSGGTLRKDRHYMYALGARADETSLPNPFDERDTINCEFTKMPLNRRERRRMFRQLPHVAIRGYAPMCMDLNDPHTMSRAYAKRLMRVTPEPNEGTLARLKTFVKQWCMDHIPVVNPMSFEEWLDATTYPEWRKDQLRQAEFLNRGSAPNKRQRQRVKAFGKVEGYYPEMKEARMICSRSDAFKAYCGPYFKSIENVVYADHHFAKHIPVADRPKAVRKLRQSGRRYFATDFTAYESHFNARVMESIECVLYRHCLANHPKAAEMIISTITSENRISTNIGISAKVKARRMSGEMNTSLGNGFSNLMLALFMAHEAGGSLDGLVEGDDGLFVCDFELDAKKYAECGFTIKIEEVEDPCLASFCGMIFSDSGEIVRDPRKFIANFGFTSSHITAGTVVMEELLKAKSLSAIYETPQCPIVGALARYGLSKTEQRKARFVEDGYHTIDSEFKIPQFAPAADTREAFARVYGISVAMQLRLENAINKGDLASVAVELPPPHQMEWFATRYVSAA